MPHLSKETSSFETVIAFENVKKDERTYSVKFAEPLTIQTRRSTVASGDFSSPLVRVDLDAETAQILRAFEVFIKAETKKRKNEWFKKAISDAYLDSSFKTYFKDGDAAPDRTALKVADDFALFDTEGNALEDAASPGDDYVFLLEATQITFGKTEYGCLWKVRQAVTLPPPPKTKCLIQVTDDEEVAPGAADDDEDYFL
jgi:hypothetical protein